MELNLRQLKTFLCIVRLGSFAAAARQLHATQPAISARIQELEQALGANLLVRAHHGAVLTPKGRALIPYAEQLVALAAQTQKEVGEHLAASGIVRIGACEPIALTWLASFLFAARERFPKVLLEVDNDLSTSLVGKLERGEVDLALVAGPVSQGRHTAVSLGKVRFSWLAASSFEVPGGTLTPQHIRRLPLISLSRQPYEYPAIEKWLEGSSEHRYVITSNDMGIAIRVLASGVGVSLLAENCCRELIDRKVLKVLRTSPEVRPVEFFATWRRSQHEPIVAALAMLAAEGSDFSRTKARVAARNRTERLRRRVARRTLAP